MCLSPRAVARVLIAGTLGDNGLGAKAVESDLSSGLSPAVVLLCDARESRGTRPGTQWVTATLSPLLSSLLFLTTKGS